MSTPADWYPDPDGGVGRVRFWDGSQWTDHTFERSDALPARWCPDPDPAVDGLRWWDGRQWTDHTAPRTSIATMPVMTVPGKTYRATGWLGRFALGMALLVAALQAGVALSVDSSYERVQQAVLAQEDLSSVTTVYDVLNILVVVALIAAWLVNAAWLHRARTNAEALAPDSKHKRAAGWAWGAWVCPIVSFWFPYQVVRDVHGATRPRGRALVGLWWAMFLAMLAFYRVVSAVYTDMANSSDTRWDDLVSTLRNLEFASFVLTALAAVVWIAVLKRIEGDQQAAAAARRA